MASSRQKRSGSEYLTMLPDSSVSRRRVLQMGAAAGGLGLMGGLPLVRQASAQDAIKGSDIEVGVFYTEGAWFDHAKSIGDSLEADYPGTKVKYTFANTESDSARALRWQNGDALDVDTGRWNNLAVTTWDWSNNGFVYNMTDAVNHPLADGTRW